MHNPEYCLLGGKWKIVSSEDVSIPGGKAKLIKAVKDGEYKYCCYWYTNYRKKFNDMISVIGEDIILKLSGNRSQWELTRLLSKDKKQF